MPAALSKEVIWDRKEWLDEFAEQRNFEKLGGQRGVRVAKLQGEHGAKKFIKP